MGTVSVSRKKIHIFKDISKDISLCLFYFFKAFVVVTFHPSLIVLLELSTQVNLKVKEFVPLACMIKYMGQCICFCSVNRMQPMS